MFRSISISKKIWFSIGILVVGYFISMVFGFVYGRQGELRLFNVSEYMFPATKLSQTAYAAFREQSRFYNDAVLMGEESYLDLALNRSDESIKSLVDIALIEGLSPDKKTEIRGIMNKLKRFTGLAQTFYLKLCSINEDEAAQESLQRQASYLTKQKADLLAQLSFLMRRFSEDLKEELSSAQALSRQQRYLSFIVFFCVVVMSLTLISLIITRSVTRPLKRTLMLEKAVEQSGDGIAVLDFNGCIKFANMAWADMHGYSSCDFEGVDFRRFYSEEQFQNHVKPFLAKVRKQGFNAGEMEHKRKDGTFFPTAVTSTILQDEHFVPIGIVSVVNDITEIKRTQEKLKRAMADAESANIAKSEFLANMSHEIRTPMNGVIGMADLLLGTEMTSEQMEYALSISKSADSLLTVINDILDYSKIEADKIELETIDFNLRVTLEDITDLMAVNAGEKDIELACLIHHDVPEYLQGDPGRLRQILMNLAGNAIKFTEKGEVVIRAMLEAEDDAHVAVRFSVTDTGIGIPPERTDRLFRTFSQVDSSTTRKYGGTGLGLVISKKLCEIMGGRMGVESVLGKGTTFWFTSIFTKQSVDNRKNVVLPRDIKDKKILVVDDNETNRLVLKGQLTSWGCQSAPASNGNDAIRMLHAAVSENSPFDIVILDMQMPEMDGETVGLRIKADAAIAGTKTIMMTSMGRRGDASRLKEIGFSAYLTKPVKQSQLYDCLVEVSTETEMKPSRGGQPLVTRHSIADDQKPGIRILLAEDNAMNQKVAANMLRKMGHSVGIANNGAEAVDAFESGGYDMILMDGQMPEMDGIEATKEIRRREASTGKHIFIVALTAHAMKGDREKFISVGMDDYLSKPVKKKAIGLLLSQHYEHIMKYREMV